jgi:hypothetical protein
MNTVDASLGPPVLLALWLNVLVAAAESGAAPAGLIDLNLFDVPGCDAASGRFGSHTDEKLARFT